MKKNKGIGLFGIIIIIGVVLIAGGVFYFGSKNFDMALPQAPGNDLAQEKESGGALPGAFTMELKGDYSSSGATRNYSGNVTFFNNILVNGLESYFVGEGGICKNNCNRTTECVIKEQQWVDKTSGEKCGINIYVSLTKEGIEQQISSKEILPVDDLDNCPHGSTCYKIVGNNFLSENKDNKENVCHDSSKYFVISRIDPISAGNDILVKYKMSASQKIVCDYQVAKEDFELKNTCVTSPVCYRAQYFYGLVNDLLIMDEGTGNERDFVVYDLIKRTEVFKDTYYGDLILDKMGNTLSYMHQIEKLATVQNCLDFNKFKSDGGGAMFRIKTVLDLKNLIKKEVEKPVCGYTE